MSGKDVDPIWSGLAYGGLGFGALAVVAPKAFTRMYGLNGDGNLRAIIRLWGTRTALISAIALSVTEPATRRRLALAIAGMDVADAALTLTAGPDVPGHTRVLGAGTSAAFAAVTGYWLSRQD
jgi:hypothetical protein